MSAAVSDVQSKSPLLKSASPQYGYDRLEVRVDRDRDQPAVAAAPSRPLSSVVVPRSPSAIAPSPPPPPSTPSRRLQLAQTWQMTDAGDGRDQQRVLLEQVEMLEAELRRKRKIASAANLAVTAAVDGERSADRRATSAAPPASTVQRPAVGV